MSAPIVLRPRFGLFVFGVVAVVCLLAVVPLVVAAQWHTLALIAPFPVVLLGLGYVVLVAPAVVFYDHAVEIRNPLRSTRLPYACVRDSSTNRGFSLVTDEGTFSAWAAPPPDRLSSERREVTSELKRDPRVSRRDGSVASSAAPGTPSGDAAVTLADRLRRQSPVADSAHEPAAGVASASVPDARVTRSWNVTNIAVVTVSIAAALALALIVPR